MSMYRFASAALICAAGDRRGQDQAGLAQRTTGLMPPGCGAAPHQCRILPSFRGAGASPRARNP
jgi:hypothetical protein